MAIHRQGIIGRGWVKECHLKVLHRVLEICWTDLLSKLMLCVDLLREPNPE